MGNSTSALRITQTGINITTSATSAGAALPANSGGTNRYVRIAVTQTARIRFGNGGVPTAAATDLMVNPTDSIVVDIKGFTHVAAIQDSVAGTVNITPVEM